MPEETTVGANTFGCLIDGWVYVGGRYDDVYGDGSNSIKFFYSEVKNTISARVIVKENVDICFTIENPVMSASCAYTNASFGGEPLGNGIVTITRFDKKNCIISGQFSGGRITHGRFDVRYKDSEY
jgi:hypothetical protein